MLDWIRKNKFKHSDELVSSAIEKLEYYSKRKNTLLKHKKSLKIKIKRISEDVRTINNKIKDIYSDKLSRFISPPIISIGFDKRSLTYLCIVKLKCNAVSFYLGSESKIKRNLQQFYPYDLDLKNISFLKSELKMIISNVIYDFISSGSELTLKKGKKLNFKNIIESYSQSGLWDFWKAV